MRTGSRAAQKIRYRHSLLSFQLNLQQLEARSRSRSHEEAISFYRQFTGRAAGSSSGLQAMQGEFFPTEEGVGAGPGLKTAPAVVNLGG